MRQLDKHRGKLRHGVLVQQNNVRVLSSPITMYFQKEYRLEALPYPPDSRDIALVNAICSQNYTTHLCGKRYTNDNERMDVSASLD